jgi:hypothetical protein
LENEIKIENESIRKLVSNKNYLLILIAMNSIMYVRTGTYYWISDYLIAAL